MHNSDNLLNSVSSLMQQPLTLNSSKELINHNNIFIDKLSVQSEEGTMIGGKKNKKVKQIDTYNKKNLEKISKDNNISLKTRDGKLKTKEQLFNSLKRKKLI